MLSWWQSIILGVVEGITEFLPISSTGHLNVVEKLMGLSIDDKGVTAYTAVIQVGAIAAAVVYFWRDIARIATAWLGGLRNAAKRTADYQMGWAIIAGVAVTVAVALVAKPLIEGPLRNLWVIVGSFVIWGLVMLAADRLGKQDRGERSVTVKDGLLLGLIQAIALIPGISRSGATISGALFMGIDRVTATRLSFFLGIPTLLAAGGFEAATEAKNIAGSVGWASTGIGIVVSFVVAYASIAWLLKFVATNNFTAFVVYRVVAGLAIAGLLVANVIVPV